MCLNTTQNVMYSILNSYNLFIAKLHACIKGHQGQTLIFIFGIGFLDRLISIYAHFCQIQAFDVSVQEFASCHMDVTCARPPHPYTTKQPKYRKGYAFDGQKNYPIVIVFIMYDFNHA